jgi:small subunit ribosomal protein S8
MVNDTISDMLTRIRNAILAKKTLVDIPFTAMNQQIAKILEKEGFVQSFQMAEDSLSIQLRLKYRTKQLYKGQIQESCITNLKRISKPGLRKYAVSSNLPRILNGLGIAIVSTSKGVMTGKQAKQLNVGGEVICYVY